jgi:hypothetical protein
VEAALQEGLQRFTPAAPQEHDNRWRKEERRSQ